MRKPPDSANLLERLREGDPLAGDPGLGADEAARMRRAILTAPPSPGAGRLRWGLAAALAVLLMAAGIAYIGRPPAVRTDPGVPAGTVRGSAAVVPAMKQAGRQPRTIHFVTAGGTRVIWTLDPEFDI